MTPRAQNGDGWHTIEYDAGSDLVSHRFPTIPKDGKWHHVVIQKGCLMPTRIFVDGVEQKTEETE